MDNCQSCGIVLDFKTASKFDPRYCFYCQDPQTGKLESKEEVRERCILTTMQFMDKTRGEAEQIADERISKLPRWQTE